MKNAPVLILAAAGDGHASAVAWALTRLGIASVLADSLATVAGHQHTLICPSRPSDAVEAVIGHGPFRSVWYRRANLNPSAPARCAEEDQAFVRSEWKEFQHAVLDVFPDVGNAFWVNKAAAATRAENKFLQLDAARAVGLAIPDTIFSSDPVVVREFVRRHGSVVFKTFTCQKWSSADGVTERSTMVGRLSHGDAVDDGVIASCPTIYQQCIRKVADVRVIVIGTVLFSIVFRSRTPPQPLDVRDLYTSQECMTESVQLPFATVEKIRALMQRLDLAFGCLDLGLDANGDITFFEVNQGGQWLYCEDHVPSVPLLTCFSSMLAQGRRDYCVDSSAGFPSFADFLNTTEGKECNARSQKENVYSLKSQQIAA